MTEQKTPADRLLTLADEARVAMTWSHLHQFESRTTPAEVLTNQFGMMEHLLFDLAWCLAPLVLRHLSHDGDSEEDRFLNRKSRISYIRAGRAFARRQTQHLRYIRRHKHRRADLPDELLQIGDEIERLSLRICHCFNLAADITAIIVGKEYQARAIAQQEEARQEKLRLRRERQLELAAQAQQRSIAPPKAKGKHVEKLKCVKCGKRNRTRGNYCDPCAMWVISHKG